MSAYSSLIIGDGPRAYWRLGDAAPPILATVGGMNFASGNIGGTLAYGHASLIPGDTADNAISFNTGWLSEGAGALLDVGDVFSIEIWVALRQLSNPVMSIYSHWTGFHYLRLNASNKIEFGASSGGVICASTVAINDLNSHHVVVTKNGATVKLYLDGVDVTGPVTNHTFTTGISWMGVGVDNGSDARANLVFDEVALYPLALSQAQVLAHYNTGNAPPSPPQTVPVLGVPPSTVGMAASITGQVISGDGHLVGYTPGTQFGLVSIIQKLPVIKPAGLGSAQAFGLPTVTRQAMVIHVVGLGSAQAFGSSQLVYPQWVQLAGVPSATQFGTAFVVFNVWLHLSPCVEDDLEPATQTTLDLVPAGCV